MSRKSSGLLDDETPSPAGVLPKLPGLGQSVEAVVQQMKDAAADQPPSPSPAPPPTSVPSPVVLETSREVADIPLNRLKVTPYNARAVRTQKRIEDLAEALSTDGQKEPITVIRGVGEYAGYYIIISGQTRYHAAVLLGWPTLFAQIDTTIDASDPLAIYKASGTHNSTAPMTALDMGIRAKELIEKGYSISQLADVMGKDRTTIGRCVDLASMPEAVLDQILQHPDKITVSFSVSLKKAAQSLSAEEAAALAYRIVSEDLRQRDFDAMVERQIKKLARDIKPRASRMATLPIKLGGVRSGEFCMLQADGRIKAQLNLVFSDQNLASEFQTRMETLIAEFENAGHDS